MMAASTQIGRLCLNDFHEEERVLKILLLGTGESGKSTIFKQMQILHAGGFTEFEKRTFRHVVRRNAVEAIQTLLAGAARMGFMLQSEESAQHASFVLGVDPLMSSFWNADVAHSIERLWLDEPAVRQAYAERRKLQLPDSSAYFFNKVARLAAEEYAPDAEDILRARLRTSGIVEKTFRVQDSDLKFIDVGGQRNERRKWIHCFNDVTAVIFVVAISEFDQTLFEHEGTNRLRESLTVFDDVVNGEHFRNVDTILFLNKVDLFREKLQAEESKGSLGTYFPEFDGADGDEEAALDFVEDLFLCLVESGRDVYPHFTCATDTKLMDSVLSSCRKIILRSNLEELGLS